MSNTLTMPDQKPATPPKAKTLEVELLYDVWVDVEKSSEYPDGIRRICTNVPVTDEYGNQVYNLDASGRPKSLKTTLTKANLPVELAKALIQSGKANRADPLPE